MGILRHSLVPTEETARTRTNRVWVDALPLVATGMGAVMPSPTSAPYAFHATQFCIGDRVLGVVRKKTGDIFYLDIGCPAPASLNALAFEDLEVELTCVDEAGKAAGMGILGRHEPGSVGNAGGMSGGVMLSCSLELSRRLIDTKKFPLLAKLGEVGDRSVNPIVYNSIFYTLQHALLSPCAALMALI
ncbi:unnamed protein product [Hydatigera taeniaeformis]|uniref:Uncharacterized protein n=1 Tax=Hydatigena taeniaeformis TaxID=6205 RepID=A0A3P7GV42_HYDTA|nr:unnamed protein product [Hydatigera taeniaeformis]